jgi:hypothetical protein
MSNGNDRQTGVETHATDDPMTSTHHRLTGYPREQNVFGGIEEVRRSGATTVASNAPKGSVAKSALGTVPLPGKLIDHKVMLFGRGFNFYRNPFHEMRALSEDNWWPGTSDLFQLSAGTGDIIQAITTIKELVPILDTALAGENDRLSELGLAGHFDGDEFAFSGSLTVDGDLELDSDSALSLKNLDWLRVHIQGTRKGLDRFTIRDRINKDATIVLYGCKTGQTKLFRHHKKYYQLNNLLLQKIADIFGCRTIGFRNPLQIAVVPDMSKSDPVIHRGFVRVDPGNTTSTTLRVAGLDTAHPEPHMKRLGFVRRYTDLPRDPKTCAFVQPLPVRN